jgi:hypothetical protein
MNSIWMVATTFCHCGKEAGTDADYQHLCDTIVFKFATPTTHNPFASTKRKTSRPANYIYSYNHLHVQNKWWAQEATSTPPPPPPQKGHSCCLLVASPMLGHCENLNVYICSVC